MVKALLALLTIALAGLGVWIIVLELRRVTRARLWPTVTGQVLHSDSTAGAGESGSATYEVRVDYQYAVSGQAYTGSNVIVKPAWSLERARKAGVELRRLYPVGRVLPVAYNPKRPAQSEIADDTGQATNYGMILVGVVFFGFFSYLTYVVITSR